MIRKLQVSNFLSLNRFSLEFTQRNVLVGPNMTGKSNIINALRFFTRFLSTNLNQALLEQQSLGEVIWLGEGNRSHVIEFLIECSVPEQDETFSYTLKLQGGVPGAFVIESEHLIVNRNRERLSLIAIERGQGTVLHLDGTTVFSSPGTNHSALEFAVPGWYGSHLKKLIASWQFYTLVPALMKIPSAIKGESFLNTDGSNFSSWFMTLQTRYPKEFREIKNVATSCLPELEEILTVPTQTSTAFLATKEKGLKHHVPIWRMSDGELIFLAFLSLIYAPSDLGSPVTCIEEPENFLNPKLQELLIELHNQRRKSLGDNAAQIILTTHSPSIVNKIEIDDLIVVSKKDGNTSATRASTIGREFKKLLKEEDIGLGELWQSGALNADK
jgi:predicted ATPase